MFDSSLSTSEVVIVICVWCVVPLVMIAVGALVWLLNNDLRKKCEVTKLPQQTQMTDVGSDHKNV